MSKKKKQNKKIRDKFGTVTLKELMDRGEYPPFSHLRDIKSTGGIIYQLEDKN
jgi:hypothetical protein